MDRILDAIDRLLHRLHFALRRLRPALPVYTVERRTVGAWQEVGRYSGATFGRHATSIATEHARAESRDGSLVAVFVQRHGVALDALALYRHGADVTRDLPDGFP